jgi:hypothetical protein
LLRRAGAYNHHIYIDAVFLEPAKFGCDVLRPLQRTMADKSFHNLCLRTRLSDQTCRENHQPGCKKDDVQLCRFVDL